MKGKYPRRAWWYRFPAHIQPITRRADVVTQKHLWETLILIDLTRRAKSIEQYCSQPPGEGLNCGFTSGALGFQVIVQINIQVQVTTQSPPSGTASKSHSCTVVPPPPNHHHHHHPSPTQGGLSTCCWGILLLHRDTGSIEGRVLYAEHFYCFHIHIDPDGQRNCPSSMPLRVWAGQEAALRRGAELDQGIYNPQILLFLRMRVRAAAT